jgi:hypothetical protein
MCDAVAADLGVAALPCVLGDERPGLVRLEGLGMSRDEIYAVAPGEPPRDAEQDGFSARKDVGDL